MDTVDLSDAVAFRYADYDTPFWARNNRSEGRWHTLGNGATQYLSLHPDGAWADLMRSRDLQTEADLESVRMRFWVALLSQRNFVDYSAPEKANAAGFAGDALTDDDYSRCQGEGQRLRDEGYAGVIAPSAALSGVLNVTIFGRRVLSAWGEPPRLASSIPACLAAIGSPPLHLLGQVRYPAPPR